MNKRANLQRKDNGLGKAMINEIMLMACVFEVEERTTQQPGLQFKIRTYGTLNWSRPSAAYENESAWFSCLLLQMMQWSPQRRKTVMWGTGQVTVALHHRRSAEKDVNRGAPWVLTAIRKLHKTSPTREQRIVSPNIHEVMILYCYLSFGVLLLNTVEYILKVK